MFAGCLVLLVSVSALLDPRNKISTSARPLHYSATMLGVGVGLSSNCGVGLNPARDLSPHLLKVMTLASYWSVLSVFA